MLSVPRGRGRPLQAYFAPVEGPGPNPGVVVIHEAYGLNDNIRDVAERFAREGYAALAVDLFSTGPRAVCMARVMNGMLLRPLRNGVVADLHTALAFLGARPEVDGDRLGAIGFCMGGAYALQLACTGDDVKVASVFRRLAAHARLLRAPPVTLASLRCGGGVRLSQRPPPSRARGRALARRPSAGTCDVRRASGSRTHSFVRSTFLLCPILVLPPPVGEGWAGGRTCRHDAAGPSCQHVAVCGSQD